MVWPTLLKENGREVMALFHAMTADGTTFSPRVRLPAGDAAFHPQVAVAANGEVVAAWDEGSSGTRRIRLARGRVDGSGTMRFARVEDFDAIGDHPALAVVPAGIIIGWSAPNDGPSAGIHISARPL